MSLPGKKYLNIFIVFIVILVHTQTVTSNINYNEIRHDNEPSELEQKHVRTTREILEMFTNSTVDKPSYNLQEATEHLLQFGALLRIQILDTFGALVYDHYDEYSIRQTEALYRVYQETLERKYNIFDIVPSVLSRSDMRPTKICRHINKHVHTCLKESSMSCMTIRKHDHPHPRTSITSAINVTRRMYKSANIREKYPNGFSLPAILKHLKAGTLNFTVGLMSGLLHNVQYDSFDDEVRTAERNVMVMLNSEMLSGDRREILASKDSLSRVHTVGDLLKELFERRKTMYDKDNNKNFAVLSEHVVREVEAISRNIELLGTVYENNKIDVKYLLNLVLPRDVVDGDITDAKDYLLEKINDYDIVDRYLKVEKYQQSGPDQLLMEILGQMRDINFAVDITTALHVHARFWHQSHMINNLNELLELFDAYENLRNVPKYSRLTSLMDKIRNTLWDSKNVTVEILCNNPRSCLHLGLEIVAQCALVNSKTKKNIEKLFLNLQKSEALRAVNCKCKSPRSGKKKELGGTPQAASVLTNNAEQTKIGLPIVETAGNTTATEEPSMTTVILPIEKTAENTSTKEEPTMTTLVLPIEETAGKISTTEEPTMTTLVLPIEETAGKISTTEEATTTTLVLPIEKTAENTSTKEESTTTTLVLPIEETVGKISTTEEPTTTTLVLPIEETAGKISTTEEPITTVVLLTEETEERISTTEEQATPTTEVPTETTHLRELREEATTSVSIEAQTSEEELSREHATEEFTNTLISTTLEPNIEELRILDATTTEQTATELTGQSITEERITGTTESIGNPEGGIIELMTTDETTLSLADHDCHGDDCGPDIPNDDTDILADEFYPTRSAFSLNETDTELPDVRTGFTESTATEESVTSTTATENIEASLWSSGTAAASITALGLTKKPKSYSAISSGEEQCSGENCTNDCSGDECSPRSNSEVIINSTDCFGTNCNITGQTDCNKDGSCPPVAPDCVDDECKNHDVELSKSNESICNDDECADHLEALPSKTTQNSNASLPATAELLVSCDNKDPHHQKKLDRLKKVRIITALHATAPAPPAHTTDDDFSNELLFSQPKPTTPPKYHPNPSHSELLSWLQFPWNKRPVSQEAFKTDDIEDQQFEQRWKERKIKSRTNRRKKKRMRNTNVNTNVNFINLNRYLEANLADGTTTVPPVLKKVSPLSSGFNRRVLRRISTSHGPGKWERKPRRESNANLGESWDISRINPAVYRASESKNNIDRVRENRSIIRAPQRVSRRYLTL